MKITVNTTQEREIEIPKFFRIGRYSYKLSSNEKYVTEVTPWKVSDESLDLGLFPRIRIDLIRYVSGIASREIIPITEREFNQDLMDVLVEMEKLTEL